MVKRRRGLVKRKRGLFLFFISLLLLIGGIYAVGWSGVFEVKEISCRLDGDKECSAEITAELNRYTGKNLLSIRKTEIETKLVSADRKINRVEINLKLPSSLLVEIIPRKSAAAITSSSTVAEAVEVDNQGVILEKSIPPPEFPKLIWPEIADWPIENRLPQNIAAAIKLTILLSEGFKLTSPPRVEGEENLLVMLENGTQVWLSLTKDPLPQLTRLQVVLNQVRIGDNQVREIDLRFDNPVVR